MKGLIRASLNNPYAVVVMCLAISVLGILTLTKIPVDILPVFKSPAVQVLTFYTGMPAEGMEKDITNRMERWTGQTNGMKRQESRSIVGASIVRNYFHEDVDPSGALTQVNSLALGVIPNLPPGTLPPVVLPFDPTSTTPVALVALNSKTQKEEVLYDVARYEVRNYIMQNPGATAPVVIGGKVRCIMIYLDQKALQARRLSPAEVMAAVDQWNLFFPSGDVRIGKFDYALTSNSMVPKVEELRRIPISSKRGDFMFLGDVARPEDSAFFQTNIVRVDGRKQVYIPVYRQVGASTLDVVDTLKKTLPEMKDKLSQPDINLELVMDQSVYVRASIAALRQEGIIGALLCSLVILLFLGQWRMTLIAILTLPLSVLVAIACLYYTGQTINVMTLAGLTLAIGPMIDSAIICLENTHRHLGMGAHPREAALHGASEVAMPELVSTLCTFLVLSPLALMPGMGRFLFLPMGLAVMFAMTTSYLLSRTVVPCFSAYLLQPHTHDRHAAHGPIGRAFAAWERLIDHGIALYGRALDVVLQYRAMTVALSFGLLAVVLVGLVPVMRSDFFPEVDSGAFEIAVRAPSGTRLEAPPETRTENTHKFVEEVEEQIRKVIPKEDLKLIVSEIGVTADWSAAYTPNAGPMDAVIKIQLEEDRHRSSQEWIRLLRETFARNPRFAKLEFSFDSGGLVRGALNEGRSSPLNIQILGNARLRDPDREKDGTDQDGKEGRDFQYEIADQIKAAVKDVGGVVDARILQRPDAPQLMLKVDRAKAAQAELTQDDIMKNVIAATNSSITYNKRNFWIDPKNGNQYYVGVQYPDVNIERDEDILNIPITNPKGDTPILLSNLLEAPPRLYHSKVPTEIHHVNLQPAIDLTMNVEGRDLGHVSSDVAALLDKFGKNNGDGTWSPFKPGSRGRQYLAGSKIVLTGEYSRMQETFSNLGVGLILASLLIYFLMVGLDRSFVVPLTVMLIVPLCLIGILPMLYVTSSAINVQSLLGFIFIVGIKVANTVLMTDYAQELRRHERLSPIQAIRKAASLRVRPVTMTALAAFFAMIPTALALEKGSEANAPLARAILGGLLAGEPATLFVLPALYSLMVRDKGRPGETPAHDAYVAHE
jgi:multidrug efflux pump subunit AcrB